MFVEMKAEVNGEWWRQARMDLRTPCLPRVTLWAKHPLPPECTAVRRCACQFRPTIQPKFHVPEIGHSGQRHNACRLKRKQLRNADKKASSASATGQCVFVPKDKCGVRHCRWTRTERKQQMSDKQLPLPPFYLRNFCEHSSSATRVLV